MNIKIKVEESTSSSVRATMYAADTNSNVGTLWMTRDEFEQYLDVLTFGIPDGNTLEVDDPHVMDFNDSES